MPSRIDFRPSLDLACRITGMRVALVGEVTESAWRSIQSIDSAGLGISSGMILDINRTFCKDVRSSRAPVWFGDALAHPLFIDSPIPGMYGFRSYISVPLLLADGSIFGTLCTLDPEPKPVDEQQVQSMNDVAALVAAQIDALRSHDADSRTIDGLKEQGDMVGRQLAEYEQSNAELQRVAKQREEFIGVLAHDLRNPVQAIRAGVDLLGLGALTDSQQKVLGHINDSADRIAELIDVTLDFARGRLGTGIALKLEPWSDLSGVLAMACREAMRPYPGRNYEVDLQLPVTFVCDAARLCQLLANLVINAAIHGTPGQPIHVKGRSVGAGIEISVANQGVIPAAQMGHLFEPFARPQERRLDSGLGLGLYIAAQIAKAHGGTLSVTSSSDEGTVLTVRL
ncbi:GAF domain-containing sensor histidine kinase [Stenotrophomonas sp.]|uniref:GAF domain-containing sensor histidine kinase n=1 Tax=Stenotrophomonas sp. TaxID=69392 RepID=UPI002D66657D|nr:GAF domain-containing sensor histidine kinase [Stenotrophomonas sp.]HYQ22329.1 GAF domain-containing sensor histidine kinase [Stenotrophomonas sp.]